MSSDANALPFRLARRQFPVKLAWAMTINKAQGQSLERVGIILAAPVFAHGQLYVGLSRGTAFANVRVWVQDSDKHGYHAGDDETEAGTYTDNVVYKDILMGAAPPDVAPNAAALSTKTAQDIAEDDLGAEGEALAPATVAGSAPDAHEAQVPTMSIDLDADNADGQAAHADSGAVLDDLADAPGATQSAVSLPGAAHAASSAAPAADVAAIRPWRAPRQSLAPLPLFMGASLPQPLEWFNDPACGAVSHSGQQVGSTCGLFAVNHLLVASAAAGITEPVLLNRGLFEHLAINAGIADDDANLIQPGGANYDVSVLSYHLDRQGLRSHPMLPETLEGRLQYPFQDLLAHGLRFRSVGYLLRLPQCGGHWIAVLPPVVLDAVADDAVVGVLCDSLEEVPFELRGPNLEDRPILS